MASNQSTWSPLRNPAPLSIDKGAAKFGEIVVFTDGRTETAGILEFAGVLAEQRLRGARLGTQADSLADGVFPGHIEPVLGITR